MTNPPILFTGRAQGLFRGVGTFVYSIPKADIFSRWTVDKEYAAGGKLGGFLLFRAVCMVYCCYEKRDTS